MAGYRPKSLDELNNMYDKTIEAEKAIIKGTSLLRKNEEYSDFSSDSGDIDKITEVILNIKQLSPITSTILTQSERIRKLTPKQVLFLPSEKMQVIKAKGRICASINIACPPAVPIVSAGEIIDTAAIEQFLYYGIEYCDCVIEWLYKKGIYDGL